MKQKDISVIIIVAICAAVFSFVITNMLFGGNKAYTLTSPTINAISSDFKLPDEKYFNNQALNPTKDITIGENNNNKPFNGTQ